MKSEHIKKANNNKISESPEEAMDDFKEYISTKTIEELEIISRKWNHKF